MNQNPHDQLKEIRSLMEKSSRFMSLSGWTGIMAGIYSLIGAIAAYFVIFKMKFTEQVLQEPIETYGSGRVIHYNYSNGLTELFSEKNIYLFLIAIAVILLSTVTAFHQSSVVSKQQGVKLWNSTTRRLFIQVAIPLATGGVFCLALLYYGHAGLIAPAMLIFYGLALLNGSKYTMKEFHSLALCEIGLGVISLLFIGWGLIFWSIGFGILHIIYGILMQKRYK
ncbi:hypothetical protein [Moheibacter sediminis]|uniref:Uncharacterized protein n=1 Tax=Moheibacter sediminis TaxID=1434700 RepID=A0A1W1YM74_9FLAO|nr:hypothetical protein [Moheibacter sediminis]SMC37305.1 hypothetical protein SAMN06296427_101551 [Moheibacter sediminis]